MTRANAWLVLGWMLVSAGCGGVGLKQVQSDLCLSLVVRSAPFADPEAICQLRPDIKPLQLMPDHILSDVSSLTLRERLLVFDKPASARVAENGANWFLFQTRVGQLEAGCVPYDTGTTEEGCVWHLIATGLPTKTIVDSELQRLITTVATTGPENSTLHLIGNPRPNGSQEQISIRLHANAVREVDWIDPHETNGFKPAWAAK